VGHLFFAWFATFRCSTTVFRVPAQRVAVALLPHRSGIWWRSPRHRTRFATISISRGRAKNSRCGVGGFGRKSFYHVLPTKQGGSEDRRTLEIVSRNYYCKPRGGFPARTHAISIDFYSLFSLLNPSPVAVAIGQETGLLGMEVRYFTRRGNTTWQTVDVGDAGINLSVCWLPGLEPLFPTCRRLAQKRRIHRTSINGKP